MFPLLLNTSLFFSYVTWHLLLPQRIAICSPFSIKSLTKATTPTYINIVTRIEVINMVALVKDLIMKVDKKTRRKFYKSTTWLKKRKEILERDNNECQLCKMNGYATVGQLNPLDVHHKVHLEDSWNLRLSDDNLITVCRACHNLQHPEKLKKFHSDIHAEKFE